MYALLQNSGQMIENATDALARVNRLLSDRNLDNVAAAVQDVRTTTDALAGQRAMFAHAASTLAKLDAAATDMQATAGSVREIAGGSGRQAAADVSSAAADLKLAVHDARAMIAKLDAQSGTIGTTALPTINATMLSLQQSSAQLDGFVRQLREDPRGTLAKGKGKELELPR